VSVGLVVRCTLPGSRERVFAAWTRPELMCWWFHPEPGWTTWVEADVRVAGSYRLEMRGVVFEEYDLPGVKTAGGMLPDETAAWFKDSEGNTMALIERG
jgi:uncharacterized protein YndB with AHSA1/START domain